jgi:hypothetical protein
MAAFQGLSISTKVLELAQRYETSTHPSNSSHMA